MGISRMQGPHEIDQKSSKTTFPRMDESATLLPFRSGNLKSGAGRPSHSFRVVTVGNSFISRSHCGAGRLNLAVSKVIVHGTGGSVAWRPVGENITFLSTRCLSEHIE